MVDQSALGCPLHLYICSEQKNALLPTDLQGLSLMGAGRGGSTLSGDNRGRRKAKGKAEKAALAKDSNGAEGDTATSGGSTGPTTSTTTRSACRRGTGSGQSSPGRRGVGNRRPDTRGGGILLLLGRIMEEFKDASGRYLVVKLLGTDLEALLTFGSGKTQYAKVHLCPPECSPESQGSRPGSLQEVAGNWPPGGFGRFPMAGRVGQRRARSWGRACGPEGPNGRPARRCTRRSRSSREESRKGRLKEERKENEEKEEAQARSQTVRFIGQQEEKEEPIEQVRKKKKGEGEEGRGSWRGREGR